MTNVNVTENKYNVTVTEGDTTLVTVKSVGPQGADAVLQAGDRGDFTVSVANNGAQTAVINSGAINNDKVAGDAAIHGTKIDPSFGDQNIFTNGNLNIQGGLFTLGGSTPAIQFTDNEDNPDYRLVNSNGVFKIRDNTNGADRIKVNTDGHVDIISRLDCFSGLNVTGEITGTSHIDLPTNALIKLGDNDEFEIFHNSSNGNAIIRETGGGILSLQTNGSQTSFWDSTNQVLMAEFNTGGSCTFRHGATTRLATSSTGINVTGDISVSGTVDNRNLAADGSKLDTYEADGGSYLRSDADDSFTGTLTGVSDTVNPVIQINGVGPNFIRFDSGANTPSDSIDLIYRTTPNTLAFERVGDSQIMFSVDADDQQAIFNGNVDCNSGLDVTGNITTTGQFQSTGSGTSSGLKINNAHDSVFQFFVNNNDNSDFYISYGNSGGPEIKLGHDGKVSLSHAGTTRIQTTSVGALISGNLGVTGTVDGVDIAARNTLFGALTSSSGVLTDGVTGTTQSAGDNSTKIATTAYTDTAISNLVDSSPDALNTLNELAAALGDDANFSTTVTNSIADKLPLAGGTLSGDLTILKNNAVIAFNDPDTSDPNYEIKNSSGFFTIKDTTNNNTKISISKTANTIFMYAKLSANGGIALLDNDQIQLGSNTGGDCKIYHSGTNGYINNTTGDFIVQKSNTDILTVTSTGVSVTGEIHGTSHIDLPNDAIIKLGDNDEFQLLYNSSNGNSIIRETGGGILSLQTNGNHIDFWDSTNSQLLAQFATGGACSLRNDGDVRLATSSTGIDVTGGITYTTTSVASGTLEFASTLASYDPTEDGGGSETSTTCAISLMHGHSIAVNRSGYLRNLLKIDTETNGSHIEIGRSGTDYIGDIKLLPGNGHKVIANYDGSPKLETTSTGIKVNPVVTIDGSTPRIEMKVTGDAQSHRLEFYNAADSMVSRIYGLPTGDLEIQTGASGIETAIKVNSNGAVDLHHDGSSTAKLSTTATGVSIDGSAAINNAISLTAAEGSIEASGATGLTLNASNANAYARIRVAGNTRLHIKNDGNVGIGTNLVPSSIFHVQPLDETNFLIRNEGSNIVLASETNNGRDNGRGMDFEASAYRFIVDGTERASINAGVLNVTGAITSTVSSANADILTLTANMGNNNGRFLKFSAPDNDSGSQPFTIATENALEIDVDNQRTLFIDDSGQVNLHHDGSSTAKLFTDANGIGVNGNVVATGHLRNSVPTDFWNSGSYFEVGDLGHLSTHGGFEFTLTSGGYRRQVGGVGKWKDIAVDGVGGFGCQIALSPKTGKIHFRSNSGLSTDDNNPSNAGLSNRLVVDQTGVDVTGKATMTESNASDTNNLRKITTSTSQPSGGADGDIWIVVPS